MHAPDESNTSWKRNNQSFTMKNSTALWKTKHKVPHVFWWSWTDWKLEDSEKMLKIFINRDCIRMIWKPYLLNDLPYILHVNLLYASTISLSFVCLFVFFATLTFCIRNHHTQQKTSSAQCFQTTSQTVYMPVCRLKNHMEIGVSESVLLCHSLFQV